MSAREDFDDNIAAIQAIIERQFDEIERLTLERNEARTQVQSQTGFAVATAKLEKTEELIRERRGAFVTDGAWQSFYADFLCIINARKKP